jgi:hypothetical protein
MISAFGTLPSEVLFAVFEARDKNPSTESGACAKCKRFLCQNCVPYPLEPRSNTVVYGDISMHIVVARSR